MKRRVLQVPEEEAGRRLEAFVSSQLGLGPSEARRLIEQGAVYLDGRRSKSGGARLRGGQRVLVVLSEGGRGALEPAGAPPPLLAVLFEDEHLLAVAKPAGVAAQPTASREGDSLLDLAGSHLGRPAGLVHRLDRDTSGVTVFGKTRDATAALAAQLREGTARKRYLAVSGAGLPSSGTVDLPISKDPSHIGRYRATRAAHGAPSITDFVRLAEAKDHCLVCLFPRTGRTHQIRAHLTALGAPIAGDILYGGQRDVAGTPAGRTLLHAQGLQLRHPASGAPLCLEAELPEDMRRFWMLDGVGVPAGPW